MGRPTALLRITILALGVVYTGLFWVTGTIISSTTERLLAALPAIGSLMLAAWDTIGWRLPPFHRVTHRPRLDGLWVATLIPTSDSHIPEGGNRGPIEAFLVVTQSYWTLHVRLLTAESESWSRAYFWDRHANRHVEHLSFVYRNIPSAMHQPRSVAHLGSCTLRPELNVPATVSGTYFTDRYTKGDISLKFVDRSRGHATFAEASAHAGLRPGL